MDMKYCAFVMSLLCITSLLYGETEPTKARDVKPIDVTQPGYEAELHQVTTDYETPHTKWAKPYYKGPLRVLFIGPRWGQRDTAELLQRLEMDCDVAMTHSVSKLGSPENRARMPGGTEQENADRMRLALQKPHDVIVVGNIWWDGHDVLPYDVEDEVFRQVEEGAGLVLAFVHSKGRTEQLQSVLEHAVVADDQDFIIAGIPLGAFPMRFGRSRWDMAEDFWQPFRTGVAEAQPKTFKFGQGRIALLYPGAERSSTFLLPPISYLLDPADKPWHIDYLCSVPIRAILWAAGKTPDVRLSISLQNQPGEQVVKIGRPVLSQSRVQVRIEGTVANPDVQVWMALRDKAGQQVFSKQYSLQLRPEQTGLQIPLPLLPAGRYFADVIVRQDSKSIEWAAAFFDVTSAQRITQTKIDKPSVLPYDEFEITAEFSKPAMVGTQWILRITDSLGRLTHLKTVSIQPGETDSRLHVQVANPYATLLHLESQLVVSGECVDRADTWLPIRQPLPVDEFIFQAWGPGYEYGYGQDYVAAYLLPILSEHGVDAIQYMLEEGLGSRTECARSVAKANLRSIFSVTSYSRGTVKTKGNPPERVPCLSDPAFRQAERQKLIRAAEDLSPYEYVFRLSAVPVFADMCGTCMKHWMISMLNGVPPIPRGIRWSLSHSKWRAILAKMHTGLTSARTWIVCSPRFSNWGLRQ